MINSAADRRFSFWTGDIPESPELSLKYGVEMRTLRIMLLIFLFVYFSGAIASEKSHSEGASAVETVIDSPDVICRDGEDVISIQSKNSGDERIWISKKGSSTGTELDVKSFIRLRCDLCFEIRATSDFVGQIIQINMNSLGKSSNVSMHVSFSQPDESIKTAAYKCEKVAN